MNKPGSFTKDPSTSVAETSAGVASKYPEWHKDYPEDNEIARFKCAENIFVTGVVFLRKFSRDKTINEKIAYDEVLRKIQEDLN